jgi:hypothetical protein
MQHWAGLSDDDACPLATRVRLGNAWALPVRAKRHPEAGTPAPAVPMAPRCRGVNCRVSALTLRGALRCGGKWSYLAETDGRTADRIEAVARQGPVKRGREKDGKIKLTSRRKRE